MTPGFAIVAIPAHNEAGHIGQCLAALSTQRDGRGAPLASGTFEVIVFANSCRDSTVDVAQAMALDAPHPIHVVVEDLPSDRANAGWARKRAMDIAAARLQQLGPVDGVILTSDADSSVAPTWVAATLRAIADGADAVAGYVDAEPVELMRLGAAFVRRGRLEELFMHATAHIHALADPRPHDPWPNHRVSAGASLAVTAAAYAAIGGLPAKAVGEDAAFAFALEDAGFKIRHAMDVTVTTSCRFEGRVEHGAAETMRQRHADIDAPCDGDLEPAFATLRRALIKARLRKAYREGSLPGTWPARVGQPAGRLLELVRRSTGFESFWLALCQDSPPLAPIGPLRPSDLPREIRRAAQCIRRLEAGQAEDSRSSR